MKRIAALLALIFFFTPLLHAKSDVAADHVVLGWEEFVKLWKQAQDPRPQPDKPPVDAAINRAEYTGIVRKGASEITAVFEISILAEDKWVRLPFLPASAGLKDAKLDGAPVPVVTDGGTHALLLKGAGRRTLRVVFSVANGARDGDAQFAFETAETPITLVTLTFPSSGLDVTISPAQALALKNENGATVAQALLPPTRRVGVSWRKRQAPAQELPAKVYADFRHLLTVDDAALRIQLNAGYTLLHAGVNTLKIRIPDNVTVLNVTGEGVQGWRADKGVLSLGFDRRIKGQRTIAVLAERPIAGASAMAAPLFFADDVVRQETSVGIEVVGNLEVALGEASGTRQVDVKELPAELWRMARSPLLFGFTTARNDAAVSFTVTRHDDVPVLTSTVDSANAVTVLTKDGQSVTRVAFYVRNHLKQFLALSIPEGAEVWSAFVNGRAVKPSRNAAGEILVPLDKSNAGSADAAFPVELVLYARAEALGLAGAAKPSLPKIDLPISQLLWSVYAPETVRVVRSAGNVDAETIGFLPVVQSAAAFYLRDGARERKDDYLAKAEKKMRSLAAGAAAPQAVARQAQMEYDVAAGDAAPLENHVLPIAFRIPESGRLYRFGKIMVTREAPMVTLTYVRHGVFSAAKAVLFAAAVLLLYRRRRDALAVFLRAGSFCQKLAGHLRPAKPSEAAQ